MTIFDNSHYQLKNLTGENVNVSPVLFPIRKLQPQGLNSLVWRVASQYTHQVQTIQ